MAASECACRGTPHAHLVAIFGLVPEDMPDAAQVMVDQGECNCSLQGVHNEWRRCLDGFNCRHQIASQSDPSNPSEACITSKCMSGVCSVYPSGRQDMQQMH